MKQGEKFSYSGSRVHGKAPRRILALLGAASLVALAPSAEAAERKLTKPTTVLTAERAGVSQPVSSIVPARLSPDPNVVWEVPFQPPVRKPPNVSWPFPSRSMGTTATPDTALMPPIHAPAAMPTPTANFQGVSQATQGAASGFFVSPPDTVGDVGPNHYVQCVNLGCQVFNKSGTSLTSVFTLKSVFTPLGGLCAADNDGDPIVLYDPLADRWLLSQFAVTGRPPSHECVAISQTADPTLAYYVYDFVIPNNYFNDYPKLGVWPDGYYMTAPLFEGPVFGQGAFILNRTKMLGGDATAEMVFFDLTTAYPGLGRILPADVDGVAPPANEPNTMASIAANEFGDPADGIRLFQVKANWSDPPSSTFTELFPGSALAVAAFDPTFTEITGNCGFAFTARDDIEQPPPANCGQRLDALSDRPLHRLAYRAFAGYESLVFNHTVDVNATPPSATSGHRAGIRYYELRRTLPAGTWAVQEQATFSPDATHRWMGSAAMDGQGNIAVGYSVSDTATSPGVRYAGRLAGDPAGGLFQGETLLSAGGRSQTSTGSRWGDYSAMSVDPSDDCTFWYTQEYYDLTAPPSCSATACWTTRIGSFKFPGCTVTVSSGTLNGTVTDAATTLPLAGVVVQANGYSATTNGSGGYSMTVPAATYGVSATKSGYGPGTASGVVVPASGTTTQDFALGTGSLAGTVTNAVSLATISGALVTISGGTVKVTNGSGAYSATLPAATYSATASAPGFFSQTLSGLVVATSGATAANFALQPAPNLATGSAVNDAPKGNANGIVDTNECFNLTVTVTNNGASGITGVSGTITTSTAGVNIVNGTSAYPDIAGGGASGANTTPFQLETAPSFAAGTPIALSLALTTAQGPVTLAVTVQSFGGAPTAFSATGPVPIPDNDATGATLAIPVSGLTLNLSHVTVQVRITHTFDGDLVLRLISPGGQTVLLAYQVGGAGAGFGTDCPASANDTAFDDTAATSILAGTAPFVGTFRPQGLLSGFAGLTPAQANGTWLLKAQDLGAVDTGNIECVTLLITTSTPGPGNCAVPAQLMKFEAE